MFIKVVIEIIRNGVKALVTREFEEDDGMYGQLRGNYHTGQIFEEALLQLDEKESETKKKDD